MEHAHGIPWHTIGWQVFNLGLLLGALIFFLRKAVPAFFKNRQDQFEILFLQSSKLKDLAEAKLRDYEEKITALDRGRAETLTRAQADAVDLRKKIVADAEESAKRIQTEAATQINSELVRAQAAIRNNLVDQMQKIARDILEKDTAQQDHTRLQENFFNQIQAQQSKEAQL